MQLESTVDLDSVEIKKSKGRIPSFELAQEQHRNMQVSTHIVDRCSRSGRGELCVL